MLALTADIVNSTDVELLELRTDNFDREHADTDVETPTSLSSTFSRDIDAFVWPIRWNELTCVELESQRALLREVIGNQ
jgi:hypothetical protein